MPADRSVPTPPPLYLACLELLRSTIMDARSAPTLRLALLLFLPLAAVVVIAIFVGSAAGVLLGLIGAGAGGAALRKLSQRRTASLDGGEREPSQSERGT